MISAEYLKDWNDACVYARECLPPFLYDLQREPWNALLTIAVVCGIIWWWNERR